MRRSLLRLGAAGTGSLGVLVLSVLVGPGAADALPAGCSQPNLSRITCTFTTPGEHVVPIPATTIAVTVKAVGGHGGNALIRGGKGGAGASVSGSLNPAAITAGQLYAEVGDDGADDPYACQSAPGGGANGGGPGSCDSGVGGGGGGGASDVRTVAVGSGPVGSMASLQSRVLVAAGGGGASFGLDGGAAGQPAIYPSDPARPGQPGTATGPGNNGYGSAPGGLGVGGTGQTGGGGGGAGLYGGGGGNQVFGGGGGGSSLVPAGGSVTLASSSATPSVTIDLTLRPVCARTVSGQQSARVIASGSGLTCIDNATIRGAITVAPGASVLIDNSMIVGSVTSFGAASFTMCASTATSVAVAVTGTSGPVVIGYPAQQCPPDTLVSLAASHNSGGVTIEDNTIRGSWLANDNAAPVAVNGNHG